MGKQQDNKKGLWQNLSNDGLYTGTYEQFHQQFSNPKSIENLYNQLRTDELYTKSYQDFDNQFFGGLGKPTEVSPQGSNGTSETSREPIRNYALEGQNAMNANVPSTEPVGTSSAQLPPLADPTNIAPQIQQANRIATDYGVQGDTILFDVPEGFEYVEGEVDPLTNRLRQPFLRNLTTGFESTLIPPTEQTTQEQAARLREQGSSAINPDKVTFTESIANSWKNMLDRFQTIPMRQEIANGGMLQIRPEAIANMTDQQREAAFAQARENYLNAYESLEQFQRENPSAPTREIVESWQNNDASGLVAGAFNALTGFATSLALGSLSGGIPLAVDIVGDFKNDYNQEKAKSLGLSTRELAERGLDEDKTPIVLAGISYAAEKVGLEGVGKAIPKEVIGRISKAVAASPVIKSMISGIVDMGGEGLTEVISQGLQDTSSELASTEEYTGGEVLEKLVTNTFNEKNWENFWQGAIGKGLMNGSTAVSSNLLRKSANNPELRGKVEQIIEVANAIQSSEGNNPALNVVFNNLVADVAQGVAQETLEMQNLSEAQQTEVDRLEGEIVMMEDSKSQVEGNESVVSAVDGQIARNQEEIENIKTDATEQADMDNVGTTIEEVLSPTSQAIVMRDGEVGQVRLDGQTVVFETADTIRELGNVDEISANDLSAYNLEIEQPLNISVADDNSVTVEGTMFTNPNAEPMDAFNLNENGDVVSVTLQNENGRNRTIRGQRAQEIAYLYTLKNFEQNATEEQVQEAIAEADSLIAASQETRGANAQTENGNNQETSAPQAAEQETGGTINEAQQPNLEINEVPSESSQVAPVGTADTATQEVVDGVVDITATPTEIIAQTNDNTREVVTPTSEEIVDPTTSQEVIPAFATPLTSEQQSLVSQGQFVEQAQVIQDSLRPERSGNRNIGSAFSRAITSGEITYDQAVTAIESAGLTVPPSISRLNPSLNETTNQEAIEENEPAAVQQESVQESTAPTEPAPARRRTRTPKSVIKGISDRLAQTGLVNQVDIVNSETLSEELGKSRGINFQRSLFGFTLFNDSDFTKTIRGRITGIKPSVQQQIRDERSSIEKAAKSSGTWLKAPNGRPSNLNAEQWVTVRTKRFKDWFGDWQRNPRSASKVLDVNEEPMLYYSGSSIGFNEFSKDFFYSGEGAMYYGAGFYFTPRLETARSYSRQSRLGNERRSFANEFQEGLNRMAFLIGTELPTRLTAQNRSSAIQTITQIESLMNDLRSKSRSQNATITSAVSNSLDSARRLLNDRKVLINSASGIQLNLDVRSQVQNVMDTAFINTNQEIQRAETFGVGEGNVFSVFLNARNPLNWEGPANPGLVSRINKELSKRRLPQLRGQYRINGDIYRAVADSLGEQMAPSGDVRQYTQTSELFNSIGIDAVLHTTFTEWNRAAYFNQAAGEQQLIVFEPNQIKSATANEGTFSPDTADIRFQSIGSAINGFYDPSTGRVVINEDTAGVDTPIHEFAHAWEQLVEKENPALHARGMELIQTTEGQPYVDFVQRTQPGLTGSDLYKEALVQAIGDRGARLIKSQKSSPIKQWLKDAWEYIGKLVGITGMTAEQIGNLTLNEYADAVAVDLLSGQPYARLDNGDTLMETTATTESKLDNVDKFMSDFMLRMKKKNGINFQGEVDGGLSAEDFTDLITFFRYATDKGQIDGIQGARDLAKVMGINSPAEVDMAYKLSKIQTSESTGFKKSEVSPEVLKNTDFTKISDDEYRGIGRRLVEDGLVNPRELVTDIINEPRALQPWEVTALQYYRTQIESQIAEAANLVDNGTDQQIRRFDFQGEKGYKGIAAKMEVINSELFDMEVAMLATASQQSAAFRLRSLMSDKDFNIVTYLAELKARGYVDPSLEAKLKELSNELNVVRAQLKTKSEEAESLAEQIAQGNIVQEASQPVRQTRKVRVKKEIVNAVNVVLDALDFGAFGLPTKRFQANNRIRFQASSSDALSEAVTNAVAEMKSNIAEGISSVPDAIEQAISSINETVGEANWDSVKFRSTITNQLVQQSVPVKVKKPYVNSEGLLVVPGEYIKQLARDGIDTIDGMVAAVQGETGGAFDSYDIRNAISGYGRQSARNRSDLERKISKARRVARYLSQIEDLETKGERLKTNRQRHDNDTEINNLKEQVRQLEYELEMTPEERAQLSELKYQEGRRKYLQNYIDQIQERIDNKDFSPANRQNKFEDDAETRRLRAEAERIKNEFKAEKYKHELENRTRAQKMKSLAYDIVFNITRGLSAGADLSAIGVQGAIYTAANPIKAAKLLFGSMKQSFSEAEYNQYFADLQADPFYDIARRGGLNLQLPNFYQSVQEEQFKGGLPIVFGDFVVGRTAQGVALITGGDLQKYREFAEDKLNPFTVADRNYSVVLSQVRMDLFKTFITNQINKRGLDVKLDEAEIKRVAETVNTITMASKVPAIQGKVANDIVSAIMFSARKFVATWKILGAWAPLIIGPNRNTQLFYDAYGKTIGKGLGTMLLAAALPTAIASLMKASQDDDEEDPYFYNPYFLDPRHSDFLKLKAGNTRISFFQGIDGNVVYGTRMATGEYMTSSSQSVRPLNGEGFNKDRLELSWDYISNKFAPTTSIIVQSLQGDRERQEAYGRFRESLAPMWITGIKEQYEDTGNIPETSSLAILGILGLSYNNYGGAEFAKKRGTDNKKAQAIFDRSGLSAYDPAEGQRTYFDGKKVVKVQNSYFGEDVYKDKYLPAYQQFMTEAVLSNENKLGREVNWEIKEGFVKKLKAEAYKYAELKTSGVLVKGNFNKFSEDGVEYRLLESQYPIKADYIRAYMDREAKRDRAEARREVMQKFRADKVKATDAYRDMLIDLYIYNKANKFANEKLLRDMREGELKLVKQAEYNTDMESQEFQTEEE